MPYRLVALEYSNLLDEVFTNLVIQKVSNGIPIIISVLSKKYSGLNGSHAICLASYKVDKNGFMDFQVVDSARGIMWVPRERIGNARSFSEYLYRPELKGPRKRTRRP